MVTMGRSCRRRPRPPGLMQGNNKMRREAFVLQWNRNEVAGAGPRPCCSRTPPRSLHAA